MSDLKSALRQLRKHPFTTAVIVLTIALLIGVSAFDPIAYAAVLLLIGGVGLFASFWPAKRAAELNPMEALRYE